MEAATSWCMDRGVCKYHLGSYHFDATMASQKPKIRGQQIVRTFLPTSAKDPLAVSFVDPFHRVLRFNPGLDFVIYEVDQPLAKEGMEGVDFYPYQVKPGDQATLYAYVGIRGKLAIVSGSFTRELENGLLEFHMRKPKGVNWPGASGGLIVDADNRAIGLVAEAEGETVQAVPVWAIADFIWHEQHDLYQRLFPHPVEIYQPTWVPPFWATPSENDGAWSEPDVTIPESLEGKMPLSESAPRPFLPQRYLTTHEPIPPVIFPRKGLVRRGEESPDVKRARDQADAMLDRSRDWILEEYVRFGGDGDRDVELGYSVRVVNGKPTIRKLEDGGPEKSQVLYSPTNTGVADGDAWVEMPRLIASRGSNLPLLRVADRKIRKDTIIVFRFTAKPEDNACMFHSKVIFERVVPVSCEGEVWFTEGFEMVRIEQKFTPPRSTGWGPWDEIVSYGPSPKPRLPSAEGMLPATIYVEGELLNGRKFYSFTRIMEVSGFGVSARIDRSSPK